MGARRAGVAALAVAILGAVAGACGGDPAAAREPAAMVYAAASLRDVAAELEAAFAAAGGGRLAWNFAGSNVLARQVVAAPGADLFVSADRAWVEHVVAAGRAAGAPRPVLENRLVVVARRDAPVVIDDPWDLAAGGYRHLALADPAAVPAGRYARAHLERLERGGASLWSRLEPRVVPALDVRAALALVESDPEIVGIVYRTDALASPRVEVRLELAPPEGERIAYWAVPITGGDRPETGHRFLDFLATPAAREVARRHGFRPPEGSPAAAAAR